eukprot:TRINITY_DN29202_c0_g1_i1.p1 TRINITY_DN29202_c0_g1~~TRINITY_DN29202_c0_g1_i1.p1  ORF type:complete len:695 (-),score=182.01 TRINITY_DN29202_c0_g1_i1:18-1877(-)
MGARVEVLKPVRYYNKAGQQCYDGCWQAVLRVLHFERGGEPEIQVQFEDAQAEVAEEATWFLRDGLGRWLLRDALGRWQAFAVQKWLPQDKPEPLASAASHKTLMAASRALRTGECRLARDLAPQTAKGSAFRRGQTEHAEASTANQGALRPTCDVAWPSWNSYPWLPSANAGVGGPAVAWLSPEVLPEWAQAPSAELPYKEGEEKTTPSKEQISAKAAGLYKAIQRADFAQAFVLLDEQAVNFPVSEEGACATHAAAAEGLADMLQLLLEARAEVGKKDLLQRTPLMMSLKKGSVECTKLLLEAGAYEAAEEDLNGRSLADMLAQSLDFRASPELLHLVDAKERPRKQGRVLLKALAQRDFRTAETALEAGASLAMLDEARGDPALLVLARGKWPPGEESSVVRLATKMCKAAGGDINIRNARGETALLFAAHRGDLLLVQTLLDLNADPAAASEEGSTALMYAAHAGHQDVCVALLEACAPPAAQNRHGLTAEQMAAKRGFGSLAVLIAAHAMGPKRADECKASSKPTSKKVNTTIDLPDVLDARTQQVLEAMRPPSLQAALPEVNAGQKKQIFDYDKWDKIVDDIERKEEVEDRRSNLEQNAEYVEKNGTKMRVML